MSSFEEKVKKEILKSGLPSEIKVTNMLKKAGWTVINEYPYLDRDENKIRTLDLTAKRVFSKADNKDDSSKSGLACELYVECKKSSKQSWVFFTEKLPQSYLIYSISRVFDDMLTNYGMPLIPPQPEVKNKKEYVNVFCKIPIAFNNLNYKIALSQQNVFSDKEEFYEGKMQVLKALRHKDEEDRTKTSETSAIVIPIIVFDGHIFECYYDDRGELSTPEIEYTRYLAHGLPNQRLPALIDVVTLNYFPEYLKLIENEIQPETK